MITASFFILATALPPPKSGQRSFDSLALTLLDGEAKNDKQPRHIERIIVASREEQLLPYLETSCRQTPTSIVAILGFTHRYVGRIARTVHQAGAALYAINAPGTRHPAALVAVACRTMRVNAHHLHHSDGRSLTSDYISSNNVCVTIL